MPPYTYTQQIKNVYNLVNKVDIVKYTLKNLSVYNNNIDIPSAALMLQRLPATWRSSTSELNNPATVNMQSCPAKNTSLSPDLTSLSLFYCTLLNNVPALQHHQTG